MIELKSDFGIYSKIWSLKNLVINFFLNLVYSGSLKYLVYSSTKLILEKIWFLKKCGSKCCFCQSDCRIFKSSISLEQNHETAWCFACLYKFMEIKCLLKNTGANMVRTMDVTGSQDWSQDSKIGCIWKRN